MTLPWPQALLQCVLAIPDYCLATEKARAALPPTYTRSQTVYNLQRFGMLVAALSHASSDDKQLDSELHVARLHTALQDDLHQPYRAPLVPGLAEMLTWTPAMMPGLVGVCLSGAGPTILALVQRGAEEDVVKAMREAINAAAPSIVVETLVLDVYVNSASCVIAES
jgi:homoserine kinase